MPGMKSKSDGWKKYGKGMDKMDSKMSKGKKPAKKAAKKAMPRKMK